jgi:quercetin dioxygenase-like cupin family protein
MLRKKTDGWFAKGTTNTKPRKLMLAGAIVACAFGGIALQLAWATPGSGVTTTILSGPTLFVDDVKEKSESDINEVEIEMKGFSDVYIVHNKFAPGGHTGWHSHPGISIVTIRSGTATFYQADDPNTPHVFPAGTGFVEPAGHVHIGRNEGTTDLEIVVLQVVPLGAPRRIDEDPPF